LTCPDLAGPLARTAAGRGLHIDRRLLSGAALRTAAAVYLCGLLLWLALGLLPYLVEAIPAARHLATGLAQGHGALAPDAQRILGAGITGMGAGPGNMAGMTGGTSSTPSIAGVAFQYLFSLVNLAMGALLLARRFDDLVARLMALALLGTAATFNGPSHAVFHEISANGLVTVVHFTFHIVSGTAYLWAVVLFPDGEFPRPLRSMPLRRAFVTAVTVTITVVCWRSSFVAHPPFFVVFFGILVCCAPRCSPPCSPPSCGWRYVPRSSPEGRPRPRHATGTCASKAGSPPCSSSSRWCCSPASCGTGSGTWTCFWAVPSCTAR
jgi:hypothetical protein